ncbi:MAG: cytochrome oxidase mono-heme subunit/FixO [Verrucomicrobiales bacterium]|nr:cytochrome oxidase mono-heme subunit/FixO [Verrucomicrobiales bacterium]
MNYGPLLFLGVFITFACSWLGMIFAPQLQIGSQEVVQIETTGQRYPSAHAGQANQGEQLYRSLGCASCHTQVVRPNDVTAGLGVRISVAQDYLYENPVMLGSQRIGPDLKNIGLRQPDMNWQLKHLYNPRALPGSEKSPMPKYPFLFTKRPMKEGQPPSPDRVLVDANTEIIATPAAYQLVSYLFSLHAEAPLFEAPLPQSPKTNAVPDSATTNAPATNAAANTNSPAK